MHTLRSITLFLLFVVILFACNDNNSVVSSTIGTHIHHPAIAADTASSYTILRFVENPVCTSCQLHAGQWKVFRRQLEKRYGSKVRIVYLIETESPEEAKRITGMYKPAHIVHVDTNHRFMRVNNLNDKLGKDFVMLLDPDAHVIAIGDPCEKEVARRIYSQLIDSAITYRDYHRINSITNLDLDS